MQSTRIYISAWSDEFVDFATRTTKCFKQIICIAHNAKAFNTQFILKYIIEETEIMEEPRVILNGTKIIVMTIGRTKFIDSVNYIRCVYPIYLKLSGCGVQWVKALFHICLTQKKIEHILVHYPMRNIILPNKWNPLIASNFWHGTRKWRVKTSFSNFNAK